jgi:hypothetical protein
MTRITTSKSSGNVKLNIPVNVSVDLNLTTGNIVTTSSNILTMLAGSGVSAVSDAAFVDGPCSKIGFTGFTYPIGKNGFYRPVSTNTVAASGATNQFTGEYFETDPRTIGVAKALSIHHLSWCEFWRLDRNAGTANVPVVLSYRSFDSSNGCSGVVDPSTLVVAGWNSAMWADLGNGGLTGTALNGTIQSGGLLTSYGPLTLASKTGVNPLPIELISFTATPQQKKVQLDWITASEKNNAFFTIEKSQNGIDFSEVKKVNGAGNSSAVLNYHEWDETPYAGVSFYRLKQTDFDGTLAYSEKVMVNMNLFDSEVSIAPNPFNEFIQVITEKSIDAYTVQLTDMTGKIIVENKYTDAIITLSTTTLSPGAYLLKIISPTATITRKVIKK